MDWFPYAFYGALVVAAVLSGLAIWRVINK